MSSRMHATARVYAAPTEPRSVGPQRAGHRSGAAARASGERPAPAPLLAGVARLGGGSRLDTRHPLRPPSSRGDRDSRLAFERAGRPARAEVVDAGRGALRRRGVVRADGHPEAARRRAIRPRPARRRPGRAEPGAEPRARGRAPRREAARRAGRAAPPSCDASGQGSTRAAARRKAPPGADESAPEAAERRIDSLQWTCSGSHRCSPSSRARGPGSSTTSAGFDARSGRSRWSSRTPSPTT